MFASPDIQAYMELLKDQKAKDEREKRKLDQKREREIVGMCVLMAGEENMETNTSDENDEESDDYNQEVDTAVIDI